MTTELLRYRPAVGTASGRRSGWIKHVTSVDPAGRNGYAVQGDFLPDGRLIEIPAGAILLDVSPQGSVKHDWQRARVYRVEGAGDGTVRRVELTPSDEEIDWRRDFLRARDVLIEALTPAVEEEGGATAISLPPDLPGRLRELADWMKQREDQAAREAEAQDHNPGGSAERQAICEREARTFREARLRLLGTLGQGSEAVR